MAYDRAQYRAWVAQKRCPVCRGKRKASVGVLCRVCRAKHNAAQNARYHLRKLEGICDWCLGPSGGRVYCDRCAARRKLQPARARFELDRGDRSREYARRNAKRRRVRASAREAGSP